MNSTSKRLGAEELERKMAPFGTIVDLPTEEVEPIDGGGGGSTVEPEPVDQPGNSDDHRNKPWHRTE